MIEKATHLMVDRKQRERERKRKRAGQDILQKHAPVTHSLQPRPTFHSSTISQQSIQIVNPLMD
jgi:hypothetical protein